MAFMIRKLALFLIHIIWYQAMEASMCGGS